MHFLHQDPDLNHEQTSIAVIVLSNRIAWLVNKGTHQEVKKAATPKAPIMNVSKV